MYAFPVYNDFLILNQFIKSVFTVAYSLHMIVTVYVLHLPGD